MFTVADPLTIFVHALLEKYCASEIVASGMAGVLDEGAVEPVPLFKRILTPLFDPAVDRKLLWLAANG